MILRNDLARLVAQGKKTQARVPRGPDEERSRFKPGRSYAIQPGRSRSAIARVVIVAAEAGTLGSLTLPDALAEGFRTRADFAVYWFATHERLELEPEAALKRLETWQADSPVWVLRFVIDRGHQPRLLAASPGSLRSDYTHDPRQAMSEEPEAIDERTQQRYSTDGRARDADRRPVARETQASLLGRRVRQEALASLRAGADIDPELAAINRELASIERKRRERRDGGFSSSARGATVRRRPASTPAFTVAKALARGPRTPAYRRRTGRPFRLAA